MVILNKNHFQVTRMLPNALLKKTAKVVQFDEITSDVPMEISQ
uniref:Uncharacterized protein n=1 Tax=Chlorobium phaeobacteroides (strain BS1) TaxID=331678 RepID=B3ENE5_CHLPB